jgi:hypothetical protein
VAQHIHGIPHPPGVPRSRAATNYRHVNQAERFESAEMKTDDNRYRAVIPARYPRSLYPLQYYFELKTGPDQACSFPGFAANLANQPYFVVRRPETGA